MGRGRGRETHQCVEGLGRVVWAGVLQPFEGESPGLLWGVVVMKIARNRCNHRGSQKEQTVSFASKVYK